MKMKGFAAAQARYEAMLPYDEDEVDCPDCKGSGIIPPDIIPPDTTQSASEGEEIEEAEEEKCSRCEGTGQIARPEPECDGPDDDYDDYDDTPDDYEGP